MSFVNLPQNLLGCHSNVP